MMKRKAVLIQPDPQDWAILEQASKIDHQAFLTDGISVFNLSQFTRSGSLYCLVIEGCIVVGEAVILKNIYDNGALVFGFAVDSACQSKGYGAIMLELLKEECLNKGIEYLELTMNPENTAAKKLYTEKFGFVKKTELSVHPEKGEPRWLMRLDLK